MAPAPDPLVTAMPRNPVPLADPAPTPTLGQLLEERDDVVTISVLASSAATTSAAAAKKTGFPVAIAIPALVGGMALAVALFGLWFWLNKRRKRERRRRWEAHQRRKARQKANAANSRPSAGTSRQPSGGVERKSPIEEKHAIPPVPVLTRGYEPQPKIEQGYGYAPEQPPAQDPYYTQPPIEQDHYQQSAPVDLAAPIEEEPDFSQPSQSGSQPSRPSRSTARIAAAESAAARANADPVSRHRPNKPSPLALKGQKRVEAGYVSPTPRMRDDDHEEMLSSNNYLGARAPSSDGHGGGNGRQVSGEWGVALGSPAGDQSFAVQQGSKSRWSNDPYLTQPGAATARAPSGQYSTDPYDSYHEQPTVPVPARRGGWL